MAKRIIVCAALLLVLLETAFAQYPGWQHSGSLYIVTTPEGADLLATASERGFPLLVRLDKDWFDFKQAKANGEDIRFATTAGTPLAYQIDQWDAAAGTAAIWVRIPTIKGNAHQEIKLFWGKADAQSESSGQAVFNASNGYLSVFHMDDPVKDETGALEPKDQGTAPSSGMIGKSRRFSGGKGINCGENITTFPIDDNPHSTELWFRDEKLSDRVLCWGNGEPRTMVQILSSRPPHILADCYGPASIHGKSTTPKDRWIHVMHTYEKGESRLYVNGRLDAAATSKDPMMALKSPVQMYMGGWRGYGFHGDMDEVRISKVARSADWVKLQYENQKPLQTVVGPLVQPGADFAVSQRQITLLEGRSASVTAKAGGARKIYWILKKGQQETLAAVDQFTFTLDAGRVTGDEMRTLVCKAICADTSKTIDIPVTIKENIPEPVFTLKAPTKWDGRETIEVVPQIANLQAMQAKGAGELKYDWTVSGVATIREVAPGKLILKRANNSGMLDVAVAVNNGGKPVKQTVRIAVKEPAKDTWTQRIPDEEEKPVDGQFFARDDKNEGTLYYKGFIDGNIEAVFLKVYAGETLIANQSQEPSHGEYAFRVKLKPGLIKYKVEFGSKTGDQEKVRHTVRNLVCGDAYIIDGQSNAVAYNYHNNTQRPDLIDYTSDWIRTYGSGGEAGDDTTNGGWGNAVLTNVQVNNRGGVHFIGVWGMVIAKKLVEDTKVPVCIFNGAVGGTRIDQHRPDPSDRYGTTDGAHSIYRNLLRRIVAARLTHGIRGVLWHQGEADQGYDGPDNCYGCETHQQYFIDLTAAWKQDYPNIQHYYLFQIWPNACGQGGTRHSDKFRDVQRRLSRLYSNLSVMPTLAFPSGQSCHFVVEDYERMGLSMVPLLQRDAFGKTFDKPVTAPDLQRACYTSDKRDEIALEFDQPMAWNDALAGQFYLDGKEKQVVSGAAEGNIVKLRLVAPTDAEAVTYLDDRKWDRKSILYGQNGIAALTFCEAPIETAAR